MSCLDMADFGGEFSSQDILRKDGRLSVSSTVPPKQRDDRDDEKNRHASDNSPDDPPT